MEAQLKLNLNNFTKNHMKDFFDPASRTGSAFNDIFGTSANAKPQTPPPAVPAKCPPTVARIGAARPINELDTAR